MRNISTSAGFTAGQDLEGRKDDKMLLKWIGGLLIIAGCGSVGFRMAANHKKEERTLEMLKTLICYMQCELQYRLTPLPELCSRTANEATGVLKKLFQLLAQELEWRLGIDRRPTVAGSRNGSRCR